MIGRRTLRVAAVVPLLALLAASCAPAAPTTPAETKPTTPIAAPAPQGTAPAGQPVATLVDIQPMTLKVADTFPPTGFVPEMRKWWADEITQRTNGKVQFQFFWSDSLFKYADATTNLAAGVADIANVASTYDPSKTQLWMTLDMPFNAKDYWCGIRASRTVAEEEPNLKSSFEQLGFKPAIGYSSGHFHFLAKNPILKLSDLQGKRVRSYGGARVKMYELLGLSPIFMPYGQIYEAVERGVIDGAEATILLTESFKHYEVAKHLTIANSGFVVAAPLSINLKTWNSFPPSLKQIFQDAARDHDMEMARRMMEQEDIALKNFQDQFGMQVHRLSPEDQQALEKAGKEAQEGWLAEMESKGVPARATWSKFVELQQACEKDVAAKGYPWKQ